MDLRKRTTTGSLDRSIWRGRFESQSFESQSMEYRALRAVASASSALIARPTASRGPAGMLEIPRLTVGSEDWLAPVLGPSWIRRTRAKLKRSRPRAAPAESVRVSVSLETARPKGPPWFYGFVIGGETEELTDLIRGIHPDLDDATACSVLLTYIWDPAEVSPVYERLRDPRLRAKDAADKRAYDLARRSQAADHLRRREEFILRQGMGLALHQTPCIPFFTDPPCAPPAILWIDPAWIADAVGRRRLGRILVEFFQTGEVDRLVRECHRILELTRGFEKSITDFVRSRIVTASRQVLASEPILILEELRERDSYGWPRVRLHGCGRFHGIARVIGHRETFFFHLFLTRGWSNDQVAEMVVPEEIAVDALLEASRKHYLKLGGKDLDQPRHRLQKNFGHFVNQMPEVLQEIFIARRVEGGKKEFVMRLSPSQMVNRVASLHSMFPKQSPMV